MAEQDMGMDAARDWLVWDWEVRAVFRARAGEPTATQWQILNLLKESGPLPLMAVADRLAVTGATVARAVAAAAAHGWLVKDRDPHDRRLVWLRTTPSGDAACQATAARVTVRLSEVAAMRPERRRGTSGPAAGPGVAGLR